MNQIVMNYRPDWWTGNTNSGNKCAMVKLQTNSTEYKRLFNLVKNFSHKVKSIQRIENPYLYAQYLIKKEQYSDFSEYEMYHDTAYSNVESIAETNFDYRVTERGKYGNGVSFATSTFYANCVPKTSSYMNRAMIVADVLVSEYEVVQPNCNIDLPEYPTDTTRSSSGKVYVKYYDNEFYPKYVIHYIKKIN